MAARRAAEVAFAVAAGVQDADVEILTVPLRDQGPHRLDPADRLRKRSLQVAHQIVEGLEQLGHSLGVQTVGAVREGPDPETVILREIALRDHDLLVIGTDVRPGSERLHLGPRVERILLQAPCPVLVLNSSG
jgi:nucleotide-binding universal stress UspA family protein